MSAQPSEPPPSNEELDRRLHAVEEFQHHILPGKVDAVAYGLSLVHADVRAIRKTQEQQGEALVSLANTQGRHGEMLAEILRRLPAPPG